MFDEIECLEPKHQNMLTVLTCNFFLGNICVYVCTINTVIRVRGLCARWFVILSWQWSFIPSFGSVTGNWIINNHYIFIYNKLYSQVQVLWVSMKCWYISTRLQSVIEWCKVWNHGNSLYWLCITFCSCFIVVWHRYWCSFIMYECFIYAAWLCFRNTSVMLQLSYNFNAAYFTVL